MVWHGSDLTWFAEKVIPFACITGYCVLNNYWRVVKGDNLAEKSLSFDSALCLAPSASALYTTRIMIDRLNMRGIEEQPFS